MISLQRFTALKITELYIPNDKMVLNLIERLWKNLAEVIVAVLLRQFYKTKADAPCNITCNDCKDLHAGDKLLQLSKNLLEAQQMCNEIRTVSRAGIIIPEAWSPAHKRISHISLL